MATMNSVIEQIDGVKPNVFTEEDKYKWIATVDGMVSVDVLGQAEPTVYDIPEDADKPLLVPAPFDDVYALYVASMIDFHNREYNNYNNSAMMFSDRMDAYKSWYIRTHAATARNFKHVMG